MPLQNLQAEFAEFIFSEDKHTDCVHPSEHMDIYRNNIIATLTRTLRDIYPLITQLLGEDFFEITAKEYIRRYPSRSSNLHDYGEYFSDFLAEYPPLKDLIYLTEVAQFEWICHRIYFAADAVQFDTERLKNLSPDQYPQIHLVLHPASRVTKFHYPIMQIIELCKGKIDSIIDMHEGVNLLIIRRDHDISLLPLEVGEFTFLSALEENQSLSVALDDAMHVDAAFKLDEKLPNWINDKTIVDYYLI